jgi:two-component system, OmpR family, sensor histidine kinase CiaH
MFRTLRLRLTAYIVAVLAVMLVAVGVVVYVLLSRQLDAAVQTQLAARLPPPVLVSFAGPPVPLAPLSGAAGYSQEPPTNFFVTTRDPLPSDPSDAVPVVAARVGTPPDGTFVNQWQAGDAVATDPSSPTGLPDAAGFAAARPGHDDIRTVQAGDQRYRLLTRSYPDPIHGSPVLMQAGVSLASRDREEQIVLLALAGGGLVGMLLTAGGGWLLTNRAVAPLETAFDRQRRFVADASHELRTPLALIRLEAEDLASRLHAEEQSRPLLGQVARISRLVDNLMLLARLEEHAIPIEREPVRVRALLEQAASDARRLAAPDVEVRVSAPSNCCVSADLGHLQQILLILLDNACRATPAGGHIGLSAEQRGSNVLISVADDGSGIPKEHLKRVFERFHRVDVARSRSRGGAGLGLAIAQQLAGLQGGRIQIESEPGCGTTVQLSVPAIEETKNAIHS